MMAFLANSKQALVSALSSGLVLLVLVCIGCCPSAAQAWDFPSELSLRAGVLHAPPFAILEERADGSTKYSGFQIDLVERLKEFAKLDNVTLTVDLSPSPPNFNPALDLVANDCNTTENPNSLEDCQKFDFIIANYYATPARCTRVALSPPWARSTITTLKHVEKDPSLRDYNTLKEAEDAGAPICVKDGTFFATVVKAKFPKGVFVGCPALEECIATLKRGDCVLSAEDELMSRYSMAWDVSIEVTREQFNTQYKVWPYSYALPFETRLLMEKWVRDANTNATLDELYSKYFQKSLCPAGTAGDNCDRPCDPIHGTSDKRGVCVCESTKWTGEDCSIEVEEELNLIPGYMVIIAYTMLGINVLTILICAGWLLWQRNSAQVRVSQPFFLVMVLIGCLISSCTIIALAQQSEGNGPVPACMAIPWLYSVGFSITFGTLFAKIRRVYNMFMNAARAKGGVDIRKNAVTVQETVSVIGAVLLIDVFILVVWTVLDPLYWERNVISTDQFGAPLESEGHCTSDNWVAFAATIASLHLLLLGVACWMCYVARDIPTKFSEGKYLSIAMISNLQIFIVGVPILLILGADPQTGFFVRSVIIWMNDLAVVTLIFGNLMYNVHVDGGDGDEKIKEAVGIAMNRCSVVAAPGGTGETSGYSKSFVTPSRSVAFSLDESSGAPRSSLRSSQHMTSSGEARSSKHSKATEKTSGGGLKKERSKRSSFRSRGSSSFESEADDDVGPFRPFSEQRRPPDVLNDKKQSWGMVNFSTVSAGNDDTTGDYDDDDRLSGTPPSSDITDDWKDERESKTKPVLPPASLPKERPAHMSYAEARIAKLRGQQAKVLASKQAQR